MPDMSSFISENLGSFVLLAIALAAIPLVNIFFNHKSRKYFQSASKDVLLQMIKVEKLEIEIMEEVKTSWFEINSKKRRIKRMEKVFSEKFEGSPEE